MADDEKTPSSGEEENAEEETEEEPEGDDSTGPESDNSVESERKAKSKAIPYERFHEVNEQLRQYRAGYETLHRELEALKAEKAKTTQKTSGEDEEKPLTQAQIKAIDRVLRQSHPQLFQKIEQFEARERDSEEAMIGRAERDITKMAEDAGFATDEESLATIAEMVGSRIRDDEQLASMWRARDPMCLELGFKKVQKQLQAFTRKSNGQMLKAGRKIAKLPTAPLGGTTTSTPKPESKNKGKGITSGVHEDAWAVLQSHMQQE